MPHGCLVLLSNIPLLLLVGAVISNLCTTLDVRFIDSEAAPANSSSSGHSQHCMSFISLSKWHLTCSKPLQHYKGLIYLLCLFGCNVPFQYLSRLHAHFQPRLTEGNLIFYLMNPESDNLHTLKLEILAKINFH